MAEEGFQCRAINDYYAGVTDELDLQAGALYTIMQTSPSGWWYAYNEDGEDGWVPSNYLERIDEAAGSAGGDASYDYGGPDDGKNDQPVESSGGGSSYVDNTPAQTSTPAAQTSAASQPAQSQPQTQTQPETYDIPKPSGGAGISIGGGEKPITEWTVDETIDYLRGGVNIGDDFKLTQACRFLTQLATTPENCARILQLGGLDVVFEVMRHKLGDVAIQMSCCAAVVVLCANPSSKNYPAQTNGSQFISSAIKQHKNYRPFVILAFNAVCNFCHDHPYHRDMVLQTDIIDLIVEGMEQFRGDKEGHRVQIAGCLALRNVAADPKGQATVGRRGVEVIVQGVQAYRETREVVESGMGVLCNLCALQANGEAFVMNDGLRLLDSLFSDANTPENVKLAAASVLHNLAANGDTALLLSSEEGIDLLMKIIKKSPVDSLLFLNTLKVLAALLFKLPDGGAFGGTRKTDVMNQILARGLVAKLNEAVQYDNKELQEVAATVFVVIAQTNAQLASALAEVGVPVNLVGPCLSNPTGQMLHCSFAVFFHVSNSFENQNQLVDAGILDLLTSDWYARPTTRADTVNIGAGIFIKLFSNLRNQQNISAKEPGIREFVQYLRTNKPDLAQLADAIEGQLNALDPSSAPIQIVETTRPASQQQQPEASSPQPEQAKQISKEIKRTSAQVQEEPEYEPQTASQIGTSSGRTHEEDDAPPPPGIDRFFPYSELQAPNARVDNTRREAYLSDAEFEQVMGMNKDAFYNLRPWKQKQLKKQKSLF